MAREEVSMELLATSSMLRAVWQPPDLAITGSATMAIEDGGTNAFTASLNADSGSGSDPNKSSAAEPDDSSESNPDDSSVADSDDSSASDPDESSASGVDEGSALRDPVPDPSDISCIQETAMSADGEFVFTSDYDRSFNAYTLTSDAAETSRCWTPYTSHRSPNPIWALAVNPTFDMTDLYTTLVLVSRRDEYITSFNPLLDQSFDPLHTDVFLESEPPSIPYTAASYKLINDKTEKVTAPTSLAYYPDGSYFFAGENSKIAVFDIQRTDRPYSVIPTKARGNGFKGQISALAVSPLLARGTSLLAAGSRNRKVGIYDAVSQAHVTDITLNGITGDGVSYIKWSPCGEYLYIAERKSDTIVVWDVRCSALVSECVGRNALTTQKMGFDLWSAENYARQEVWAGGTDGWIGLWKDPQLKEGKVELDELTKVADGPVSSTLIHPTGGYVVAASGGREGTGGRGRSAGGGRRPQFREWGQLELFQMKRNYRLPG